jgi:hypothetical protein
MPKPHHTRVATLRRRLIAIYGANRQGNPNLTQPGHTNGPNTKPRPITYDLFDVGPGVVRGWLKGSPRAYSSIPTEQLDKLHGPNLVTAHHEFSDKADRWCQAIQELQQRPLTGTPPNRTDQPRHQWWEKGWLDPHLVAILSIPETRTDVKGKPLPSGLTPRQVIVGRPDSKKVNEWTQRGRHITQVVRVPTYFHAQLVAIHVMMQTEAAAITPPPSGTYRRTISRVWNAKRATAPDLEAIAETVAEDCQP